MEMELTLLSVTLCQIAAASSFLLETVTTAPPAPLAEIAVIIPVPCINGQAGKILGPPPDFFTRATNSAKDLAGGILGFRVNNVNNSL